VGCLTANDGHVSYQRLAAGSSRRGGGRGICTPATKRTAEAIYGELEVRRFHWWWLLVRRWPESLPATTLVAAGARGWCGLALRCANARGEGLAGHYALQGASWTRRGDHLGAEAAPTTSSSGSGFGRQGGDVYGSKSKGRKEGIHAGAHSGSFGGLSELGEASEQAHGRRRSRWPEVEEDGGEGVRVRPASLGLVRRSRTR